MKNRNQTVELFRILAFVGVVMIHAWPGMGWAGRWAVPYFAFLACYFGHTADVEKLAKRLLPPFIAWSIMGLSRSKMRNLRISITRKAMKWAK